MALIQVNEGAGLSWYFSCRCRGGFMFRHILVPVTGDDNDGPVCAAAFAVAHRFGSHLQFLHVEPDLRQTLVAMASGHVVGGGGLGYYRVLDSLERRVAERRRSAELAFDEFCQREKLLVSSEVTTSLPSAEFVFEVGEAPRVLAKHGRATDLIVLGRAREGARLAWDVLSACLMGTGRPMLIAPAKMPGHLARTVAIAWKNRPEAARAVAAAQPFLEIAGRVVILHVEEDAQDDGQSCERLAYALSWHNPHTTVQSLKRDGRPAVVTALVAAGAAEADMLVMGGYGHSRLREVIHGGFTRHALHGADLPILMAH
jgi:nucleotide-binding universal stress UspA family protein